MLTADDARRAANQQTFNRIRDEIERVIKELGYQDVEASILDLKYIVDFIIPRGN
jgi:hypothetical protein